MNAPKYYSVKINVRVKSSDGPAAVFGFSTSADCLPALKEHSTEL